MKTNVDVYLVNGHYIIHKSGFVPCQFHKMKAMRLGEWRPRRAQIQVIEVAERFDIVIDDWIQP